MPYPAHHPLLDFCSKGGRVSAWIMGMQKRKKETRPRFWADSCPESQGNRETPDKRQRPYYSWLAGPMEGRMHYLFIYV